MAALVAFLSAVVLLQLPSAFAETWYRGYPFDGVSHGQKSFLTAASYMNITYDVCYIQKEARTNSLINATLTYGSGQFSIRRTGLRVPRSTALRNYSPEPWYRQYAAYFKGHAFLETFLGGALNGDAAFHTCPSCPQVRRESVAGYAPMYAFMYLMHEIDSARGSLIEGNRTVAAAEVSDSAAVFLGPPKDLECSLWNVARIMGREFCTATAHTQIVSLYNQLLTVAEKGTLQTYDVLRGRIFDRIAMVFVQLTLSYSKKATAARDECLAKGMQAAALASLRAAAPRVASTPARAAMVSNLGKLLDFKRPRPAALYTKVAGLLRAGLGSSYVAQVNACS